MGQTADLVVVGAGIAGAGTAFFAAHAGLRVTVVDVAPAANVAVPLVVV